MMIKYIYILLLILLASCYKVPKKIEPQISYKINAEYLLNKPPVFEPLSAEEETKDWAKEYAIGLAFAKQFDLYRAVSTFKRAQILIPKSDTMRKTEIEYYILLSYFYAQKHSDLIDSFENSNLPNVDKSFPAFHDLLTMLYQSYKETKDREKQEKILDVLKKNYPETAEKLSLSSSLLDADQTNIRLFSKNFKQDNYLDTMLTNYTLKKKSVAKAQFLNAILPGAGYLYIGQKQSAITAFLVNGLFIAAAYQFFHRGYQAAGIITVGFEMGWYFGGIYGAGEEAKLYNERMYENVATPIMNNHQLYPIFMMQASF